MVQRYLPEVRQGDKRIMLIDGEPVGAVLRVPAAGEARANLHVGGRAGEDRPSPRASARSAPPSARRCASRAWSSSAST